MEIVVCIYNALVARTAVASSIDGSSE